MQNGGDVNLLEWYWRIPVITRLYLTGTFLVTAACAVDVVSPLSLYYNYYQIFHAGQVWRLVTNFLFFGPMSLHFFLHMYFMIQQCMDLEANWFSNRSAEFLFFILLGATAMMLMAPFVSILFYSSAMSSMIVYLWSRRNRNARMALFWVIIFRAPYLPWVILFLDFLSGRSFVENLIGIGLGHVYYFLADVWPRIAESRHFRAKRLIRAPRILYWIMGETPLDEEDATVVVEPRQPVPQAEREREPQAVAEEPVVPMNREEEGEEGRHDALRQRAQVRAMEAEGWEVLPADLEQSDSE